MPTFVAVRGAFGAADTHWTQRRSMEISPQGNTLQTLNAPVRAWNQGKFDMKSRRGERPAAAVRRQPPPPAYPPPPTPLHDAEKENSIPSVPQCSVD